jgi:3-oxoadipate enol-lactonase
LSGQVRSHPRFDEAAEEIMEGILDPVFEQGSVYREV